jgi:hypothetical protein
MVSKKLLDLIIKTRFSEGEEGCWRMLAIFGPAMVLIL